MIMQKINKFYYNQLYSKKKVHIKRFINKLLLKITSLILKNNNKASINFIKNSKCQY